MNKKFAFFAVLLFSLTVIFPSEVFAADSAGADSKAEETVYARPSSSGELHLKEGHLYDQNDKQVILQGVSTHGINWFPEYINQDCFDEISSDWNANLIRVVLYSDDYSNNEDKDEYKSLMKKAIDYAVQSDMYIIVDWHILDDSDPNENIDEAKFFSLRYPRSIRIVRI